MILSTVSLLQSDNDVSTSNSPPARNIVMIYLDYFIETYIPKYQKTTRYRVFLYSNLENKKCCICKNTQIHSLFLPTHP